jgi:NADH:ubiquinone reductase (H+-translocating)
MNTGRHHVVIVGSGFAGLAAAKVLGDSPVDVTVIDRTNHRLFQPLLYQVATGILSEGDIAPPIRDILRRQANTTVILGAVTGLDTADRRVTVEMLGHSTAVHYDSLIVATGAHQSYFGHPEFARHAPGLKTIDDALELRGRIFGAFEMAESETNDAARQELLTFAVVGAGPTGVEVAGQIAELAHRSLGRDFRTFNPSQARVILLDAAPRLLGAFPKRLQKKARQGLERLGVEVRLDAMVVGVDAHGLDLGGTGGTDRIDARTVIWAAGVEASPLGRIVADATGATVDRAGRVAVGAGCTVPGHPEIFVVGDLMALDGLPGLAQVAIQSGRFAARSIDARVTGKSPPATFRYADRGTLATISRFDAIGQIGRLQVSGFVGWVFWLGVHLLFLTGFKNRISTLFKWAIAFAGTGRPERTITERQVFARRFDEPAAPATPSAAAQPASAGDHSGFGWRSS